jgi:hypothetical protein
VAYRAILPGIFFLYILKQICSFDTIVLIENMRPLTAEETTTLFEKLAK